MKSLFHNISSEDAIELINQKSSLANLNISGEIKIITDEKYNNELSLRIAL